MNLRFSLDQDDLHRRLNPHILTFIIFKERFRYNIFHTLNNRSISLILETNFEE